MEFEAGTMSPTIFWKKTNKQKTQTQKPHSGYCCSIQNTLSYEWQFSHFSPEIFFFLVKNTKSFTTKHLHLPIRNYKNLTLRNKCINLYISNVWANIYFTGTFIQHLSDFWFTFANAVVIYTAVFILQTVIRTRTVTSR